MKKIILKLFILATLCVAIFTHTTPPAHAQTDGTINLLGYFGGATGAVFVDGDTAYIGIGGVLAIMDISDPTNPIRIGESDLLPDVIQNIKVVGSVAYIADGSGGLVMVDVSDPADPALLSSYHTAGFTFGVQVVGSVAYIADGFGSGLVIVDVSDPAVPTLLGSYDTAGSANDVQVVGSVAYIADHRNGLMMVDVSDPATPALLGLYDTAGHAIGVQVAGSVAYVVVGVDYGADELFYGLVTVDVSNPAAPTLLGSYDTAGHAIGVQVVGNVAYMVVGVDYNLDEFFNGLVTLDVSDPAAPTLLGSYHTSGYDAQGIQVVGSVAYIADGFDNGLVMVDVSNLAAPALLDSYNITLGGYVRGVEVVGGVAYIADGLNGLVTVDVSDPALPTLLGSYNTVGGSAQDVQVVGNVAYIADSNRLMMVDVSDPAAPTLLGSYDTTGNANGVQVVGSVAYIADSTNGLVMVDISDPVAPTLLGSYDTVGRAERVQVVGSVAYIADPTNGLVMVDVSDPAAPTLLSSYDTTGNANGVNVVGSVAYIADSNGLVMVDVSNPAAPALLSLYNTGGYAGDVQVEGSVAYTSNGSNGLVIVDVSDPAAPALLGSYDTAGNTKGLDVVDNAIYVTSYSGGLYMLEYVSPPLDGDQFEIDDACVNASAIATDGTAQAHTFHDEGDVDWVKFDVEAGKRYGVIGNVPLGSPADLVFEIFDGCDGAVEAEQGHSFAPGVRLDFEAPTSGTYYLKVYNNQANVFGDEVAYSLSVREMVDDTPQSAVIIVAGRHSAGDILQDNIHHVTNEVYKMYRGKGHDGLRMQYFATDLTLDPMGTGEQVVDGYPTVANLQEAITSWAVNRVSEEQALTIYMMSHGDYDRFFLDGEDEVVTPAQLDEWLTTLEETVGDVPINVVIDACHSGSFIESADSISKPGRVVITSAERSELAWATRRGAVFSDIFTFAVRNDYTLYEAFNYASGAASRRPFPQTPWLDDNGNGIPNDPDDGLLASIRGFEFKGAFDLFEWEPYIDHLFPVTQMAISARVLDDSDETPAPDDDITHVWAVLYPPSYTPPPEDSTELVAEDQPTITLLDDGGGVYAGSVCLVVNGETGEWSAIVYAEDGDGLISRPETITFTITTDNIASCPPLAVGVSGGAVGANSAVSPLLMMVLLLAGGGLTIHFKKKGQKSVSCTRI